MRPPGGWDSREGSPLPLGVRWIAADRAFNFALYSKHATDVTLCLFDETPGGDPLLERALDPRCNKTGRVWHCRVAEGELSGARYYAYRVSGPPPAGPPDWHSFDGLKLLLDPYATAVHFPPGFDRSAAMRPGSNIGQAPMGVLPPREDVARRPATVAPRHQADAIIYELHVRQLTQHPSAEVPADAKGTFAGVVAMIPYLLELGVTVVELMPVFARDPAARDRWGYMPLSFMAPHGGYAQTSDAARVEVEFREMVDALHAADIEVVLDVVYNHTCEGGPAGPVYSLKGIDNSTYYLMTGDPAAPYADFTGTGNTLHCANQAVRQLIVDSMHHWVTHFGADGFRFDMASIFARGTDGQLHYRDAPILGEIGGHSDLAGLRLIAEPWDGAATQLGRAFPGVTWQQWNGRFRDDVRRFVRGDPGMVPALMRRLYGSDDLFPDDLPNAYRPVQSVNYVSCHDGFTLYDLVSYAHKRNWANGLGNADGPHDNFSCNCGWEGDEHATKEVLALRARQAKNLVLLVMLANGTPMLRAGDEFLQTQGGNDNPFCLDDPTVWLDWSRRASHHEMFRFVREAIAFRKAHPTLCRSRFWREDVRWHGTGDAPDLSHESRSLAYFLDGASEGDDDLYVMINAWQEALVFTIQDGQPGEWRRVIDTARPSPHDILPRGGSTVASREYAVDARSIVVLVRAADRCRR